MSSALGDYVHLYAEHYLEKQEREEKNPWKNYNIAHEDYTNNLTSSFLANRTKNIDNISKNDIDELNKRLAGENYETLKNDEILIRSDRQDLIDEIYKELQKVTSKQQLEAFQRGNRKVLRSNNLNSNLQQSKSELEKRVEKLRKLKQDLNKMIKWKKQVVKKEDFKTLLATAKELDAPIKGMRYSKDRQKMKSKLGEIKKAVQTIQFDTASHHISGDFGEQLFYRFGRTAENVAQEEINNTFEKIVGNERSRILIDKELVALDLSRGDDKILSTDEIGNSYSLGSTKDKVDVQIMVGDETKALASIKTVSSLYAKNLYGDVGDLHLQDVTLFSVLTYLNAYGDKYEIPPDFGTHWLNMHTALGSIPDQDSADEILKQEIAYEALVSGNPFKRDAANANIFVYIDRKSGRFKIQRTLDILLNSNNIVQKFDIGKLDLVNENKKNISPVQRIRSILIRIHQIQIEVMYNVFRTKT